MYQKVEKSQGFEKLSNFVEVLGADESDDNTDIIKTKVESYAKIIASEIGENQGQILKILQKKFLEKDESVFSVTSVQHRLEEYQALTGQSTPTGNTMGDFSREEMNISEYHIPHIKSIALIDKTTPVIFVIPNDEQFDKTLSNMQEVRSRGGTIVCIHTQCDTNSETYKKLHSLSDYMIAVPQTHQSLTPLLTIIPLQLLAYYIARENGCDIDKPRNLAKSVTVE